MPSLPRTLAPSLLLLLWSRTLFAAEPDASAAPRGQVALTSAPAGDALRSFEVALGDSLAARGLDLVCVRKDSISSDDVVALGDTASSPAAPGIVARVWLDLRGPHAVTLTLTDGARRRVFVRHVPLQRGFDAVERESVLFVVEGSLEAMLSGQEIGVSREEYRRGLESPRPPPAAVVAQPPAPPPTAAPSAIGAVAAIGYSATALGAGVVAHGPSVALEYWWPRLRLGAGVHAALPVRVGDDAAGARLSTAGAGLSAAARLMSRGGFALIGGAGAGFDATRIVPSVSAPELQPAAPFWAGSVSLRGFVGIDRAVGRFVFALVAGADLHPLAERYLASGSAGTREVFVPMRLRPLAVFTLGVRL